jgi:hypothetical protein
MADGNKKYKFKDKERGVSVDCIAFGEPRENIAISLYFRKTHKLEDTDEMSKKIEYVANEWYQNSIKLSDKFFVVFTEGPQINKYSLHKEKSYRWNLEISGLLRVPLEDGDGKLEKLMAGEIENLIQLINQTK